MAVVFESAPLRQGPLLPVKLCVGCFAEASLEALEAASQPALLLPPAAAGCACGRTAAAWPTWTPASLAAELPTVQWDLGRADGARCTLARLLAQAPPAAAAAAAAASEAEPLYIFDADFGETAPSLAAAYAGCAPAAFPAEDGHLCALSTVRALRRPWRWLLVSAPGAGFPPHVDPHGTAAWNMLLHGRKRWAMLPPSTPLAAVLPSQATAAAAAATAAGCDAELPAEEASARAWMTHILPGLRARR